MLWYQTAGQSGALQWRETQDLAPILGVHVRSLEVSHRDYLAATLEAASRERLDGLVVVHNGLYQMHRARIAAFGTEHPLPTMFEFREFVEVGGLMAYGPNFADMFRRAATFVDKILKGVKPADLPIEQRMRFDFAINLRTAEALGLTMPHHVLLQATEVIR